MTTPASMVLLKSTAGKVGAGETPAVCCPQKSAHPAMSRITSNLGSRIDVVPERNALCGTSSRVGIDLQQGGAMATLLVSSEIGSPPPQETRASPTKPQVRIRMA